MPKFTFTYTLRVAIAAIILIIAALVFAGFVQAVCCTPIGGR